MTLLRPTFIAISVLAACLAQDALAQASAPGAGAGIAGTTAAGGGMSSSSATSGSTSSGTAANGNATGTAPNAATPSSNPLANSVATPSATTSPTGSNLVSGGNAFSGSSRGEVPPVGSAAVDANGVNVNGFGTGLQSGAVANGNAGANGSAAIGTNAASGTLNSPLSSDVGTGVIYPGAPYGITDTTGVTGTTPGTTSGGTPNYGNANAAAAVNGAGFTASAIATPQLDAATRREARRERATVARGGQTLNTIAPRTNVDRTNQMPDDPPSPALRTPDRPVVRY